MEDVRVMETSVVVPSKATPRRRLWVSSLDVVQMARGYVAWIYLYGGTPDADATGRLRAALADALVPFYPLAGRLAADGIGRPEIYCNAEGALFVVARSDVLTAEDVRRSNPTEDLRRLFVPSVESVGGMLGVQVTFLKCGGAVLGTSLHHIAVDAPSAVHFMQTWSNITTGAKVDETQLPCHDRSLLRARSPPVLDSNILSLFPPSPRSVEIEVRRVRPVVCKVFHISADQVAGLKHMCGGGSSTFRAVASHVWRCACVARGLGLTPGSQTRISFLVSLRRRVSPCLPEGYFGNTIVHLSASADASDIVSGTLATVSDKIRVSIDRLDSNLAQSAIDYLELASSADELGRRKGSLADTDLFLVSWLGMPTTDADFGWGNPEFMWSVDMPTPGTIRLASGNGQGVLVLACLEPASIDVFGKLLTTPPAAASKI